MFDKRPCNTCLVNPTANIKCICKRVFMIESHTKQVHLSFFHINDERDSCWAVFYSWLNLQPFFLYQSDVSGLMFSLTNPLHLPHVLNRDSVTLPVFLITISHLLPKGKHGTKRIKEDSKKKKRKLSLLGNVFCYLFTLRVKSIFFLR